MDKIRTWGVVSQINDDAGTISYYVKVEIDGKEKVAQSGSFVSSKSKILKTGDRVLVDYWETGESKLFKISNNLCDIIDDDMLRVEDNVGKEIAELVVFFIFAVVVGIICVIRENM